MPNHSYPPLVIRWLGAYGKGPSLEAALRWEMDPTARPRSAAVHRRRTHPLGRIGLAVDPTRTRLVRVTATDCHSAATDDGRYLPTRRGGRQGRTWGMAANMAAYRTASYAEAIIERPVYVAVIDAGASPDAIRQAADVTGLPVVSWSDAWHGAYGPGEVPGEEKGVTGAPGTAPTRWGSWSASPRATRPAQRSGRARHNLTREAQVIDADGVVIATIRPSEWNPEYALEVTATCRPEHATTVRVGDSAAIDVPYRIGGWDVVLVTFRSLRPREVARAIEAALAKHGKHTTIRVVMTGEGAP